MPRIPVDIRKLVGGPPLTFRPRQGSPTAGMQSRNKAARWRITAPELGFTIESPHESLTETVGFGLKQTTFGNMTDDQATSFPITSDPDTVSVAATFAAEHNQDDLRLIVQKFRRLARKDPQLRRRPLVMLIYTLGEIEGWVSRLSITPRFAKFEAPPNLPRMFDVTLEVTKAQPRSLEITSVDAIEPSTRHKRIGPGETFESIAMEAYGSPHPEGVLLRRANPQIGLGGAIEGDVIRIYEASHSKLRQDATPIAAPLVGSFRIELQAVASDRVNQASATLAQLEVLLGL